MCMSHEFDPQSLPRPADSPLYVSRTDPSELAFIPGTPRRPRIESLTQEEILMEVAAKGMPRIGQIIEDTGYPRPTVERTMQKLRSERVIENIDLNPLEDVVAQAPNR